MASAAMLLNHPSAMQALRAKAAPMAGSTSAIGGASGTNGTSSSTGTSGSNGSGNGSSDSATISANDFLTLLVTEMQNQDPTANTDPNEYIDQLVQVNSLEQLIDINQTLSSAVSPSGSADSTGTPSTQAVAASPLSDQSHRFLATAAPGNESASMGSASGPVAAALRGPSASILQAPGNLGIPAANASAERVANSLGGRASTHPEFAPPAIP